MRLWVRVAGLLGFLGLVVPHVVRMAGGTSSQTFVDPASTVGDDRRDGDPAGCGSRPRGGELVAIVGPNGAGKSTLVRALSGPRRPSAGSVHWSGRELQRVQIAIGLPRGRRP